MKDIDRMVWVSFDIDGDMDTVRGMTYAVGKLRPRTWKAGDKWPSALDIAVGNCYSFCGAENDRIIWECIMQPDYGWPPVISWFTTKGVTEVN